MKFNLPLDVCFFFFLKKTKQLEFKLVAGIPLDAFESRKKKHVYMLMQSEMAPKFEKKCIR